MEFEYNYRHVYLRIYFNNLKRGRRDIVNDYDFPEREHPSDEPCFLNKLVLRTKDTNETFQAEYPGFCTSFYYNNYVQIKMDPRDYLRLNLGDFINTTSTMPLEMYTADMLGDPFDLRIEPYDAIECDVILRLYRDYFDYHYKIDYWMDEGILMIHVNTLIDVATVNASKLSLSRNYYNPDANNIVNITGGEVLNQSPGLTSSVAIKLTSSDQDLLASKGLCRYNLVCFMTIKSGFAATHYGLKVRSPRPYAYAVSNLGRAPTGN